MSNVYGVLPTGFDRKPLDVILGEYEDSARTVFGSAVLLDPQTPLGQLLGLFALLHTQNWELAEDTYQSIDPDQAEGARLDQIGRVRGVLRPDGEDDVTFRRRITNTGRSDLHLRDLINAVADVSGVEYVRVWENSGDATDANGIPGHSLVVAVIGGSNALVAEAVYAETVAGIGLGGNTLVEIEDFGGHCRSINIQRLTQVPIKLDLQVRVRSFQGCVAPDLSTIIAKLDEQLGFGADFGLVNGEDVTLQRIIGAVSQLPGIEIEQVLMTRGINPEDIPVAETVPIDFDEIGVIGEVTVAFL
jgi:hypothetical protein